MPEEQPRIPPKIYGPRGEDLSSRLAREKEITAEKENQAKAAERKAKSDANSAKLGEELRRLAGELGDLSFEELRNKGFSAARSQEILQTAGNLTAEERTRLTLKKASNALDDIGIKGKEKEQVLASAMARNTIGSITSSAQRIRKLNEIIATEGAGSKLGVEAIKQKEKEEARYQNTLSKGSTAIGRAGLAAQKASSPTGVSKAVESGSIISSMARAIPGVAELGEAQSEAALGGKALSISQVGASLAIEGLVSGFSSAIPALTTAASAVAIVGSAVKFVLQTLDQGRMIGGKSMQAMAMNSSESFSSIGAAAMSSADAIRAASGLSIPNIAMMGSAFYGELIPAAQKAMLTFNTFDRSSANVNKWTGSLIESAVEGAKMGLTFEDSMARMVSITRSFGISEDKSRAAFRHMVNGAREANLTVGDFTDTLGDAVEWGKRFGDQSSMYGGMAKILGGLTLGTAQKMMLGQGVSGLAMQPFRLLGLATANMGSNAGAIGGLFRASVGGNMMEFSRETLKNAMSQQRFGGGQMNVWSALNSANETEKFKAAVFAAIQYTGKAENFTAFADPKFAAQAKQALETKDPAAIKAVQDRLEKSDIQSQSLSAIQSNRDALDILIGIVTNIARVLVHLSTSSIFGLFSHQSPETRAAMAQLEAGDPRKTLKSLKLGDVGR